MAKPKLKTLPKVPKSTDPNVQAAYRKKVQDIQKENKRRNDEYEKGLKLKKENQNLRAKGNTGK